MAEQDNKLDSKQKMEVELGKLGEGCSSLKIRHPVGCLNEQKAEGGELLSELFPVTSQ